MNKLKITSLALLLGLVIVSSCKDPVEPTPSAEEVQTALLAQSWKVGTSANDISLDGSDEIANWTNFSVVINANGSYAASNISEGREGTVWSTSGSWAFKDAGTESVDVNTIIRDAGTANETEIKITVSETSLKMTFDYTDPNGRASGINGAWAFNMGL